MMEAWQADRAGLVLSGELVLDVVHGALLLAGGSAGRSSVSLLPEGAARGGGGMRLLVITTGELLHDVVHDALLLAGAVRPSAGHSGVSLLVIAVAATGELLLDVLHETLLLRLVLHLRLNLSVGVCLAWLCE